MALSIDDLFTPRTAEDFREQMIVELVGMGIPADEWRAGGVASSILTVVATVLAMMSIIVSDIIKVQFLPTSTGLGLELLAKYVYGVEVSEATFASGELVLTNVGGGSYTRGIGEYIALNPTTGVQYQNTAAFTLNPVSTLTIQAQARIEGSAGNAIPGSITENVTALLGVTVTNPASFVGIDAPSDQAIRELCINKLGAMSVRGPRTAYAYAIQVARNIVTDDPVNINRWSISEASSTGTVDIFVASPSGTPDPDDVAGVVVSIEEIARPSGVTVNVSSASAVPYTATIIAYLSLADGTNADDADTAGEAAILGYISDYPIGGVFALDDDNTSGLQGLFGEALIGAIAKGIGTLGTVRSIKGAFDLPLSPGEVATDNTTFSIVVIPKTGGTLI